MDGWLDGWMAKVCCVGNDTDTGRNKVGRSLQHNENKSWEQWRRRWGKIRGKINKMHCDFHSSHISKFSTPAGDGGTPPRLKCTEATVREDSFKVFPVLSWLLLYSSFPALLGWRW